MTNRFFCYHAGRLAVDDRKPWQVITDFGCLVGQLATREDAEAAVAALTADKAAGRLPCNLAAWRLSWMLDADAINPPA
jgi:hypothetical protein